MASLFKLSIFILLAASSLATVPAPTSSEAPPVSPIGLSARLQSDGLTQCWDSLVELRSCTGEVILFFLNGETYLGPSCCRAIRVIEHHCWAADVLLASLGFTAQEGDILRGYCDAADDSSDPSTPQPPPAPPSISPGPSSH
ncbi:egg cell-secreted protein 1.4-like [Ananas comosus]|uniref:Egg cell-secreted protein 1.4-like n=1 Tax=Ananas comosus TaxID=4615 RepID=A0A6P5G4V0_ANACO|nr:egg cell-secreted protein 1.4-like [Ananas comosus]